MNTILEDLWNWLAGLTRVLCTPTCWLQNSTYSAEWDRKLNQLMKGHRFKTLDAHRARLGPVVVWIANHPYASFTPENRHVEIRPRRITILRAYDKLVRDTFEDEDTPATR